MKLLLGFLLAMFMALLVVGCATDKYYEPAKIGYEGARELVKNNADKLSPEALEKLQRVDEYASTYDKTRNTVKDVVELVKDEKK